MSWFTSMFWSPRQPVSAATVQPPAPAKRILEEPVQQTPAVEAPKPPPPPSTPDRPSKSALLFGAGAVFFALSLLTTRRALARKKLASNPAFYSNAPEHQAEQAKKVIGATEAMEALSLATINVFSLFMMGTGGALWYFKINSAAEARKMLRSKMGVDQPGQSEKGAEEDLEEWLASTPTGKESARTTEQGQQR